MDAVVDTNVVITANEEAPQAGVECVLASVRFLKAIQADGTVVIDTDFAVLKEYLRYFNKVGQERTGDVFVSWVLTNRANPDRVRQIHLAQAHNAAGEMTYVAFPENAALQTFDPSDRKFVALALTDPTRPTIINAVDRDWWENRDVLESHGIEINFLCLEEMQKEH